MSGYFIKGQNEQTDYSVDWAASQLRDGENLAVDMGWAISPQTGVAGELSVVSEATSGDQTSVVLSDGVPGALYVATSTIQTSMNRVISHAVAIRVAAEV